MVCKKLSTPNPEKCHLITTSKAEMEIAILNNLIKNEERVKLLEIHIGGNLNFDYRGNQLCEKASLKIQALVRIYK